VDHQVLIDFLASSLRLSTPLVFATLGGIYSERSGVLNIGLEGMILAGACGSAAGAFYTGSALGGLVIGCLVGLVFGLLLGVISIDLHVNQLVGGVAMNMVIVGLTSFLARVIFGVNASTKALPGFKAITIPVLSKIPILGPVLFNQDPLIYFMFILTGVLYYILFHSPLGLEIRAVGESPSAADTAGVNVRLVRYACIGLSGVLGAMGGCHLVLSQVYIFTEHMSAGKGFIALAAIILGRWNPVGGLGACLLFGLCEALQMNLQFTHPDVPYQLFSMLPYLVSIIAIVVTVGKSGQPACLGLPYVRDGK
jgi:simple sugar transport system permease protein